MLAVTSPPRSGSGRYTSRYEIFFNGTRFVAETAYDGASARNEHGTGIGGREGVGSGPSFPAGYPVQGCVLAVGAAVRLLAALGGQPVYPLVGLGAGEVRERLAYAALEAFDAAVAGPLDG